MIGSSQQDRARSSRRNQLRFEELEPRYALSAVAPALPTVETVGSAVAIRAAATIAPSVVAAPASFSGSSPSNTTVLLNWSAAANAAGYRLYQFTGGQPVLIGTYGTTATTATVTGLSAGVSYAFNLVAFNEVSSAATAWIGVTTQNTLGTPSNFAATSATNGSITLGWSLASGASGYRLYQSVNDVPTLVATLAAGASSTTVTGLTIGTTYSFNLVAFAGNTTTATPWITASTLSLPSAPSNFSGAAISGTQVQLSWSAAYGAAGYRLYEFTAGGPVLRATYAASATSATVSNLTANTTYAYNLVAFNGAGTAATPWISVKTGGPIQVPSTFAGTPLSSTQVTIYWSSASGATGYRLYQFKDGQPVLIQTLSTATTTVTISGLSPATTYAFNLVAFNSTTSVATRWINVSTTV